MGSCSTTSLRSATSSTSTTTDAAAAAPDDVDDDAAAAAYATSNASPCSFNRGCDTQGHKASDSCQACEDKDLQEEKGLLLRAPSHLQECRITIKRSDLLVCVLHLLCINW